MTQEIDKEYIPPKKIGIIRKNLIIEIYDLIHLPSPSICYWRKSTLTNIFPQSDPEIPPIIHSPDPHQCLITAADP